MLTWNAGMCNESYTKNKMISFQTLDCHIILLLLFCIEVMLFLIDVLLFSINVVLFFIVVMLFRIYFFLFLIVGMLFFINIFLLFFIVFLLFFSSFPFFIFSSVLFFSILFLPSFSPLFCAILFFSSCSFLFLSFLFLSSCPLQIISLLIFSYCPLLIWSLPFLIVSSYLWTICNKWWFIPWHRWISSFLSSIIIMVTFMWKWTYFMKKLHFRAKTLGKSWTPKKMRICNILYNCGFYACFQCNPSTRNVIRRL